MIMDHKVSRRFATLGLVSLGVTLAIPPARGQQAANLSWTPVSLTPSQARTLDVVAELIIPATDTPGAREAGVPQFVDRAVGGWCAPANALAIRSGLDRIEQDAVADYGASFAVLPLDQQNALIARFDGAEDARAPAGVDGKPFFPILKDIVTAGYFTSELGAVKALKWDPIPGAFHGCVPLSQIGRGWAL